jgi:NAD(P)H-dependent FMN reductase
MYKKNTLLLITFIVFMPIAVTFISGCKEVKNSDTVKSFTKKINLKIILGSTRQGRTSEKIGDALAHILSTRADIVTEILDLKEYNLPFLYDEVMPVNRTVVTDPIIKIWSEKIKHADAFIIVVPEYNAGYPGVLKNALDILYKEWNKKPVGFVGYSGGPSGGANAIAQLHNVARALKMIPLTDAITIPSAWKALDTRGNLIDRNIVNELDTMIDQLIKNTGMPQ